MEGLRERLPALDFIPSDELGIPSKYKEAINYLYSLTQSGIKLGLKNTAQLLQQFGDPQLKKTTIHIGGTNGKGSTAAITESILKASGYKVGL